MPFTTPSTVAATPAGLGLRAAGDLPPRTVVERFDGPVAKYADIPSDDIPFALLFDGDDWILPRTNARYLNHSCEPNCYVSDDREVLTSRRVSRGEELTIQYNGVTLGEYFREGSTGFFWDDRWTFDCLCGSQRCLGRVDRYVVACADDPNSGSVYLGITTRGRGVFARRRIESGETIEACPVIVIPETQWAAIERTVLYDYTFGWGQDDKDAALAGGYGSFYNHAFSPNATYEKRLDDLTVAIVALRGIEPNAEITVNYAGAPAAHGPLWFPVDP